MHFTTVAEQPVKRRVRPKSWFVGRKKTETVEVAIAEADETPISETV